jgi:FkbM family methyltransferase
MTLASGMLRHVNVWLALLDLHLSRRSAAPRAGHPFTMENAMRRARRHGPAVTTFIDIGASEGKWCLMAAAIFEESRFLAIEALEERRRDLEAVKHAHPRIDYEIAVVGNAVGPGYINVSDDLIGSGVYDPDAPNARPAPMVTIDHLVAERQLCPPFGIKFDTHGFEVPILEGARMTLEQTRLIVMEVYNFGDPARSKRFHRMCTHMEELGFRCFDLCGPMLRRRDGVLWQMDLFFAPADAEIFRYQTFD